MKVTLGKLNSELKWSSLAVAAYIILFLLMRFMYLTSFPLFVDEVLHIRRAQFTLAGDLFIGLRESLKQLYIWILAVVFLFFNDQLLAARAVSGIAGLVCGGLCYKLTQMLYPDRHIGYLAALFYLLSPYALFYDRMALTDSLLTMLIGTSIVLSVQLWQQSSVKWALALGFVFGLATLTKTYAALYYVTPLLFWFFLGKEIERRQAAKLLIIVYVTTLVAWLPILVIGQEAYREDHSAKLIFSGTPELPILKIWWLNLLLTLYWLNKYLTSPFMILLFITITMIIIKRERHGFVFMILIAEIVLVFAVFFAIWYSRYLLPLIVAISLISALGIDYLSQAIFALLERIIGNKVRSVRGYLGLQLSLLFLLSIPSLTFDYLIVTQPTRAPLPVSDRRMYIERFGAGFGMKESAQFIRRMADQYPSMIILRKMQTSEYHIVPFYLSDLEEISFVDLKDYRGISLQKLDEYASEKPLLSVVISSIRSGIDTRSNLFDGYQYPQIWRLASFPNPGGFQQAEIYQWLPPPDFALRWLKQGGDQNPRVAWHPSDTIITTSGGVLVDWPQSSGPGPQAIQQALEVANIEYVLATPELISHHAGQFRPYISSDGSRLRLRQIPPGWRLAFVYPDFNCRWCLFQLRPPDQPTQITFGESIALEGYDLSVHRLSTDSSIHVTLYWESLKPLSESYTVFIHLLDSKGKLVAQVDERPFRGKWPTNHWNVGDKLVDRHTIVVDPLQPGDYTISVGLYNPINLERVAAFSKQDVIIDNAFDLTNLSIE